MKKLQLLLIAVSLLFFSCKKDNPVIDNPYSSVDYGNNDSKSDTLNKYSITAIHRDIIFPNCATPGCHDGTFEPDFRSVMSTYSTTVYHSILKNNANNDFKYRVVPFQSSKSVLYERISNCCFVNTNDRMPQSNIGTALPDEDIERIKKWIDDGAKDMDGNPAKLPNTEPYYQWFWLVEAPNFPSPPYNVLSEDKYRLDDKGYNPLVLDTGITAQLVVTITDDSTSIDKLINGTLWFSYDVDDFSNPVKKINAQYLGGANPAWYATFNTNDLPLEKTLYMRYSCNDGYHANDTFNPNNSSPIWFKGVWSVIVKKGGKK